MVLQVPRDCFHPRIRNSGACASQRKAKRGAESSREDLDFAAANGEPVISHSADRKSTRLNSSHLVISYAVFCLKKKKKKTQNKNSITILRKRQIYYKKATQSTL